MLLADEQPLKLPVPTTVYVVVTCGLIVMLLVVEPVFHRYVLAPAAVKTKDDPLQILVAVLAETFKEGEFKEHGMLIERSSMVRNCAELFPMPFVAM